MKYLILLCLILITGCDMVVKPDLVIDGKEYVVRKVCVESHNETKWEYHYGYNFMNGKYEWHYGSNTETICDKSVLDTVEVNIDKKYYTKK